MMVRPRKQSGGIIVLWVWLAAVVLTGCGPTRLTIKPEIPPLLLTPMPLAMGVRIPKSFAEYVQKEKTQEREWEISLGAGQAEAIRRVTGAMFAHTLVLGDEAPGDAANIAAHKLDAILETTVDSYVYLLPSPGGADYYSATIGYKVNLISVDGKLLGTWIYEGYGSAASKGLGSAKGVEMVTGLAVRDACANLAVHLPDQELVRNLLTTAPSLPTATPTPTPTPTPGPAPTTDTNSGARASPSAEAAATPAPTPTPPEAPPAPIAVEAQPSTGN